MPINWRIPGKDKVPAEGTLCLCKLKHCFNSWSDYIVLKTVAYPVPSFTKYNVIYPSKEIIKFVPLSEIDEAD